MAKRKTTKKTSVKEADYEVTVQDTTPGTKTPSRTAKVQASSAEHAMDTASDGTPTSDAEVVTVKKAVPGMNKTTSSSQGVHGQHTEAVVMSMKAMTESVEYPYSISLPLQFRKFLSESTVAYTEVGNTVMMRFDNKSQFTEALRLFRNNTDRKATIILEGISRSLQ